MRIPVGKVLGGLAALALVALLVVGWLRVGPSGSTDAESTAAGGAARGAPGGNRAGAAGGNRGGGRPRETLVLTRAVEQGVTGDRLMALGDGEAIASVGVVARGAGVVDEVAVRSGARVVAGEPLVRLDDEAETIALDLAARGVEDAEATRGRQARLTRSQAGSRADLDAADNALARARLALRDAELTLERRTIRAPIDGTVGIVAIERGERVTSESEIVTIDDRSTLRIDFRVPERFAGRIELDQPIEATSFALPGRRLAGTVSAIGSRIETDSRTLPVQATIDNADDALRPGMSFSVEMRFAGEALPSVDPLAIQWDSDGAFVWRIVAGKAERVPVRIVQRNPESVLVAAELAPGDEVVTEGVLSLREGASVRIGGGGGAGGRGAGEGAGEGRPRDAGARGAGGRGEGARDDGAPATDGARNDAARSEAARTEAARGDGARGERPAGEGGRDGTRERGDDSAAGGT